jgi:hypothetical protein
LDDGGDFKQFGWGRFNPELRNVNSESELVIAPNLNGTLSGLRLYDRFLMTAEAVLNYKAGQ